jgi:HEAT repeat protein
MSGLDVAMGLVVAAIWVVAFRKQQQGRQGPSPRDPWPLAAHACGLRPAARDTWIRDAPGHGLSVRFEVWPGQDEDTGTRIVVRAVDFSTVGLGLRPESKDTLQAKQRGAREIDTGDDEFDAAFYVTGPTTVVRAVLDDETRQLLLRLRTEADLSVLSGEIRAAVRHSSLSRELRGTAVSHTLRRLLESLERLRRPTDVVARLAHNATMDGSPGVRRENLLTLVREYPDLPETAVTLRAACEDGSDQVRVRAAIARGREGLPALRAVAWSEEGDDVARARAVNALADGLSPEEVRAILGQALRSRAIETARECVTWLGRQGDAGATVALLAKILAVERGPIGAAAARALGQTGAAAAEPPLIDALARDDDDARVAAAVALGHVGSARAVLPLQDVERLRKDDATRRAARESVAAIQSRLHGASHGQLSLAASEAGSLALADDESGRLSLEGKQR